MVLPMYAAELPAWMVRLFAFTFGATFGSFLNVCIYRWPRHMSIVSPASHCPACNQPIAAWRNVPILAYLFLRGKAGCCGAPMTPRYVFVEVLGALLCVGIAERFIVAAPPGALLLPVALQTLAYFFFASGLIVATFIDLEWLTIPDEVTLPGAALGLLVAGNGGAVVTAADSALGAAMGFLFVQLVFVWAYERVTGRRGMGEGDPKLLLMIGAFLGWKGVLFAVVAGSMQGLVAAAVSYVSGSPLLPPHKPDPIEQWPRDALLAYVLDLFARRPDLLREEEDLYRLDFVVAGEPPSEASAQGAALPLPAPTPEEAKSEPDVPQDKETAGEESEAEESENEGPLKAAIPFGPFLALGALEFLFFGDRLMEAYFGILE